MAGKFFRFDDPGNIRDASGIRQFSKERDPKNSHYWDNISDEELVSKAVRDGKWVPLGTQEPPAATGVGDALNKQWVDPVKSAAGWAWNQFADFSKGGVASFMWKPIETVTSAAGYDPSKIKVPGTGTFTSSFPFISEPRTISELAAVPDSAAGKIGDFTGQAAQFVGPEVGLARLPGAAGRAAKALNAGSKTAKAVEIGTRAASDAALAGGQTYLQTGNPSQAANAAVAGGVLSAPASYASGKVGDWLQKKGRKWYQESLRFPRNVKLDYGEELTDRALETGQRVTKQGKEKATQRFSDTVSGMKQASQAAEARGAVIDPTHVQARVNSLIDTIARPLDKEAAMKEFGLLMDEYFPNSAPISPSKAEELKVKFNKSLQKYYKRAKEAGASSEAIIDDVMNAFLGGVKDAQEAAITETVNVGGKALPYREAARTAAMDKDIELLVDDTLRSLRSPSGSISTTEGLAYGNLAKGNVATPSQIGMLERITRTPNALSYAGPKVIAAGKNVSRFAPPLAAPMIGSAVSGNMVTAPPPRQKWSEIDYSTYRPWEQ